MGCSYMFLESLLIVKRNNFYFLPFSSSHCNDFNFEQPLFGNLLWLFYVSKIFDFFDTFFIIFGRKRRQFTFLHIYHHITIYLVYWLNVNVDFDDDVSFTYCYYLICMHLAKGQSVWWKKHLTTMQMAQFLAMNIHAILLLANGCNDAPPRVTTLYLVYIMSLFAMFLNFFNRSYKKQKKN